MAREKGILQVLGATYLRDCPIRSLSPAYVSSMSIQYLAYQLESSAILRRRIYHLFFMQHIRIFELHLRALVKMYLRVFLVTAV